MSEQHINSGSVLKELPVSQVSQSFKSKTDFLNYFKTNLQFYVPPKDQMTKDWLKAILAGQKKLLPLNDVRAVNVGNFQEVSVKSLYKDFSSREEVKVYLPDKFAKGKQIDRTYFFNVVNTLFNEELQSIIAHAHSQRNTIQDEDAKKEAIIMSEEMSQAMFKFPFISRCKGRTVHLLKAKCQSRKIMKARKTYDILAKDKRKSQPLPQPDRKRPNHDNDEQMNEEKPEQRKRITPTVVEGFLTKR